MVSDNNRTHPNEQGLQSSRSRAGAFHIRASRKLDLVFVHEIANSTAVNGEAQLQVRRVYSYNNATAPAPTFRAGLDYHGDISRTDSRRSCSVSRLRRSRQKATFPRRSTRQARHGWTVRVTPDSRNLGVRWISSCAHDKDTQGRPGGFLRPGAMRVPLMECSFPADTKPGRQRPLDINLKQIMPNSESLTITDRMVLRMNAGQFYNAHG